MDLPLVSVIIPVYNGEKYLNTALKSVYSQTSSADFQVIVIDDGSTDDSASVIKNYTDVEYYYQENKGVSAARNTGLKKVNGEFIAFLDSDDLWKPEKIEIQLGFMMENPELGVTGTFAENFLEDGTELPLWLKDVENWSSLREYIIPSTMMVRQSVFDKVGGFDTSYPSAEDTDLLWRINEAGIQSHIIEEFLVRRRFHGDNLSWRYKSENKKRLLRIARESIQRKSGIK